MTNKETKGYAKAMMQNKVVDKETFIANYLSIHMKNVNEKLHGQYLKILADTEEKALNLYNQKYK